MNKTRYIINSSDSILPSNNIDHISTTLIYKGKTYRTVSIINQIPPHLLKQVGFRDAINLQSFWDEFIRRWPDTAENIINSVGDQAVWAEKPD